MSRIIEITDYNASELDIYARLTENQLINRHETEKGMFIGESLLVIERALDSGCIPVSFLMEKKHIEGQGKAVIERVPNVPVYTAEIDILERITGYKLTRGMLCAMYRPKLPSVEDVCKNAKRIAILEDVMNPTNLGAIFRSAAALNIDGIILTPFCSNPLYRRAIRVSMGNVFLIPWTYFEKNDESYLNQIKRMGFKTVAMALTEDSIRIDDKKLANENKLAIILGTEGEGLSKDTIMNCDYTAKIPMSHNVDSLNVAAASAVAFWELCKNNTND